MAFFKKAKEKKGKPASPAAKPTGPAAEPTSAAAKLASADTMLASADTQPAAASGPPLPPRPDTKKAPSADDDDVLDIPVTEAEPEPDGSQAADNLVSFDPLQGPNLAPPPMQSVGPLYRPRWTVQRILLLVACCAVLGLGGALAWVLKHTSPGGLMVTVIDPAGGALAGVPVAVDGKPGCKGSPCTIQGLPHGKHLVQVGAAGSDQTTAQEVTLERYSNTYLVVKMAVGLTATAGREGTSAPVEAAGAAPQQSAEALADAVAPDGSAEAGDELAAGPEASAEEAVDPTQLKVASVGKAKAKPKSKTAGKDNKSDQKGKASEKSGKAATAAKKTVRTINLQDDAPAAKKKTKAKAKATKKKAKATKKKAKATKKKTKS